MSLKLSDVLSDPRAQIQASSHIAASRDGFRSGLAKGSNLVTFLAGQIPYFYREPSKIADDFASRRNCLDMIADLAARAPTSPKFQQSHCGEILGALLLEDLLGFRRLYSKLTLTTAEDTNVHKMDGVFVDTKSEQFDYYWIEAKSSVLPTEKTPAKGHRHGILKQLVESLESYRDDDLRFDLVAVRDHLEHGSFTAQEARQIRDDLVPPGPRQLRYLGLATINRTTVCQEDDDFILSAPCLRGFSFESVIVDDLAALASMSFEAVLKLKGIGSV